jgi:hypothetical protein
MATEIIDSKTRLQRRMLRVAKSLYVVSVHQRATTYHCMIYGTLEQGRRRRSTAAARGRKTKEMARELAWLAPALAHGLLLLPCSSKVHRGDFPPDFLFGTSTSAYQVRCRLHTYMNQPCLILLPIKVFSI